MARKPPVQPPTPPAPKRQRSVSKNLRVVFGGNLKAARQAAGMTQAALAEAATGITQAFVSQVEAGGNVTLETMERLADAVGMSVTDLLQPPSKAPRRR